MYWSLYGTNPSTAVIDEWNIEYIMLCSASMCLNENNNNFLSFICFQIAMFWSAVVMTATREAGLQLSWISSSLRWRSKPNEDGCQTVPLCFAHGEAQLWGTSGPTSGERSASTSASALLNVSWGIKRSFWNDLNWGRCKNAVNKSTIIHSMLNCC